MGHGYKYAYIDKEEVETIVRILKLVQPAIVPEFTPPIIGLEPPVITLEDFTYAYVPTYVIYKVEIYSDGTVHFFGSPGGTYGAYGDHFSRIEKKKLRSLLKAFESINDFKTKTTKNFFDLDAEYYRGNAIDVGSIKITLDLDGKRKVISGSGGGGLSSLTKKIKWMVNLKQWMCVPRHQNCFYNQ